MTPACRVRSRTARSTRGAFRAMVEQCVAPPRLPTESSRMISFGWPVAHGVCENRAMSLLRRFLLASSTTGILVLTACGDDTSGSGGGGGSGGEDAASSTSPSSSDSSTSTSTDASSSTGSAADGCGDLCTGAGYDGGEETDFGGGLVECVCAGDGDGLAKADCETYCATFDVAAEDALLSQQNEPDDKCVCDGTT